MKPDADTITNDEIDALWRAASSASLSNVDPDTMHACIIATNRRGDFTAAQQASARARCAEILHAQARDKCRGRHHRNHIGDVCEGSCCTACGGPIDENEECRC